MTDLSTLVKDLRIGANIPPPSKLRNVRDGLSSIFVFETRPPSAGGAIVYRYDVEITNLENGKSLMRGIGDSGKTYLMRNICYEIVNLVSKATQGFGAQALFVYDNRKNLYTNKRIQTLTYDISPDVMTKLTSAFLRNASIRVEIKPCQTEHHVLDLNDLKPSLCPSPDQQSDHTLRTFLEMLTSQTFINAGTHDVVGMGRLFERSIVKRLDDGVVARKGIEKGVRIINYDGNPKAALVADVKTYAFYATGTLARIVDDMMIKHRINPNRTDHLDRLVQVFNKAFRGVSGYLTYAPSRIIVIDSLSDSPMSEINLDVEGHTMSMVEFFAQKKNVRVNGRLPAVRQRIDRDTMFPMECIVILPNQRLNIDSMMENISCELVNANTMPPSQRYAQIETEIRKIGTGELAAFMSQFGVRLIGGKNNVKIGIHDPIKIKFGGLEGIFQDRINPAVRFLEPSNVLKAWVVAYPPQVRDNEARDFVDKVLRMCKDRGMILPQPKSFLGDVGMNNLTERMEELSKKHIQFMLYMDSKDIKSHSLLKLNEKRFGLLTQHVTLEVAKKARAMVLSNIVNKINMKLFGYNYMPILPQEVRTKFPMDSGQVLVIGVDTSVPPRPNAHEKWMMKKRDLEEGLKTEEPMIVGICANYLKNPFKFCGDYYFQPCKHDVLEPIALKAKINWVLQKVAKERNKLPSIIFIIRDGVSEGMVPDNVHQEYPAYVEACRAFNQNWHPKFVYCIVDKRHKKRFFVGGKDQQMQNTMPGCVIDSKVVRVDLHEFWLQAHVPLQGTSKIPQYLFPVNQIKANNKELQGFLLAMCSNWQIVSLATALPTPVRQAGELAKRGHNNYMELKRNPKLVPRLPGSQQIDFQALNIHLCYSDHSLSNTRFNA